MSERDTCCWFTWEQPSWSPGREYFTAWLEAFLGKELKTSLNTLDCQLRNVTETCEFLCIFYGSEWKNEDQRSGVRCRHCCKVLMKNNILLNIPEFEEFYVVFFIILSSEMLPLHIPALPPGTLHSLIKLAGSGDCLSLWPFVIVTLCCLIQRLVF